MDLQKKWDGVWKMKFIQQYKKSEQGDLHSVLWQSCDQYGFPDLAASHFDFEK